MVRACPAITGAVTDPVGLGGLLSDEQFPLR